MILTDEVKDLLLNADSKALATQGPHGLNVVPVSSIKIENDKIWLINYFMNKTKENILENPAIALAAWKGFAGYQIKGRATYTDTGQDFEKAVDWIANTLPDRTVKGLVIIDPEEICLVTPNAS